MLLKLIRNAPSGSAITGRLVINGRWFCNTLERVDYQILALCYPVRVTQSPKFKRLLPLVYNVPRQNSLPPKECPLGSLRSGIRFHRGSKPEHSTGCILVLGDNSPCRSRDIDSSGTLSVLSSPQNSLFVIGSRTSADVENQLTQLLLNAQNAHEEIILEVIDYSPGTEYGYNTPCPPELQKR